MISLIVCMGENREIGIANDMPWERNLPSDLAYFKEVTKGHDVLMGRKTFSSILAALGKPLPHRKNLVLTNNRLFAHPGVKVAHSVEEVLEEVKNTDKTLFVIGGATVYEQFMDVADCLYVTKVDHAFEADTYFPKINENVWEEVSTVKHAKDEQNLYDLKFVIFQRKVKRTEK